MNTEKLHKIETVLTDSEIIELRNICYSEGNTFFPIDTFFNDIRDNREEGFDKNQAYKDLWLIVDLFQYVHRKAEAFDIIKNKQVDMGLFTTSAFLSEHKTPDAYNFTISNKARNLTQEEWDVLRGMALWIELNY